MVFLLYVLRDLGLFIGWFLFVHMVFLFNILWDLEVLFRIRIYSLGFGILWDLVFFGIRGYS